MNKSAILILFFLSFYVHGSKDRLPDGTLSLHDEASNKVVSRIDDMTSHSYIVNTNLHEGGIEEGLKAEKASALDSLDRSNKLSETSKVDYALWASILLGCVTIIITLVSVFLAILSIVGYRNFKKSIELTVQKISTSVAKEETTKQIDYVAKKELVRLIDEGALTQHLESAVDMVYLRLRGRPEEAKNSFNKYPELDDEEQDK